MASGTSSDGESSSRKWYDTERTVAHDADWVWLEAAGLASVDRVMAYRAESSAALSRSSDVFAVELGDAPAAPTRVFVKRYHYESWWQRFRQAFRGTLFGKSRARFEYEFLTSMCELGLPAVVPLAYGEHRRFAFLTAAFLLTRGEPDVVSLDSFAMDRVADGSRDVDLARRLTAALGFEIRRLHRAGVLHGGLFWRNILVRRGAGDGVELMFLDPDRRGRLGDGPVTHADAIDDVSDFIATGIAIGLRGGITRFMRAYLDTSRLTESHRRYVRQVIHRAMPKVRSERHRVAVARLIHRLRERIEAAEASPGDLVRMASIDDYLNSISGRRSARSELTSVLHFEFGEVDNGEESVLATVSVRSGRLCATSGHTGAPMVSVRTDVSTWLALVNAQPEAFALLRGGRLRLSGDTTVLAALASQLGL